MNNTDKLKETLDHLSQRKLNVPIEVTALITTPDTNEDPTDPNRITEKEEEYEQSYDMGDTTKSYSF